MALSRHRIEALWDARGGNPAFASEMARIALRESGGRARINNRGTNSNGTTDWGLYQVNDVWRRDPVIGRLFRSGRILTPKGATDAAIRILTTQGPQAWRTGNSSIDARYLSGLAGGRAATRGGARGPIGPRRPAGRPAPGAAAALLALTRARQTSSLLPPPLAPRVVSPLQPSEILQKLIRG